MRLFFILALFLTTIGMLPTSFTAETCYAQIRPWPRASTMPFPWNNIQGTWTEKKTEYTLSFQVIRNSSGERLIKINQLNSKTGESIAWGIGSENSDRVVVAAMTGGPRGQFILTVRSLQDVYCVTQHEFIGVTIESFNNELINYFEIFKINEIPLTPNKSEIYKEHHCGDER